MLLDIIVPAEQEGTRAVVANWLKQIGDLVAVEDPILELETDKVTVEVYGAQSGTLVEILVEKGAETVPGAVLGRLDTDTAPARAIPISSETEFNSAAELRLSPAVRRAVIEYDIDPRELQGTGRDGRLTKADVIAEAERRGGKDREPQPPRPAPVLSAPVLSASGKVSKIPHDRMRRRIALHMSQSLNAAPHVTAIFEADFTAIMSHRQAHKAAFAQDGINLTFTAYFVAACVEAMKAAPSINSRWFDDHIEIYEDINIGIGTALGDKGLIVPVIHRAQDLSLKGIASRLQELTEKARTNRLVPADVQNGTFSISNHGVSGSLIAAPIIINQPQSAILGIGKLEKRVVVREIDGSDTIQIRPLAFVSLSIDHRVLDGHQTNGWLARFVECLEKWK